MQSIFLFTMLFHLLSWSASDDTEKTYELNFDKNTRSYTVFEPAGLPKEKIPVLFFLHGGLGNSDHAMRSYGLNELAKKNKFLMVYPNGIGLRFAPRRRTWNAGSCCGSAMKQNINDVGFIEKVVGEIEKNYNVDRKRFYVTGMSNGAMLSYKLMCEKPGLFAAAIPVAGTLAADHCIGAEKTALLHIHGSVDESVPFSGGVGKGLSGTNFRSVSDSIKIVATARQCKTPVEQTFPSGDIETRYDCSPNAPVVLRKVAGGGHSWPGSEKAKRNSGNPFIANEAIWSFISER